MGSANLSIRPAVASDLPVLADLWFAFETWLNLLDVEPSVVERSKFDRFEALALGPNPQCAILIAHLDRKPVGYLVHYLGVWMDDMAPCLHVADLFVLPDHHRHGTGRRLMQEAREIANRAGAKHLFWTVWRKNAGAMAFYKSLGAEVFDEELLMTWQV